MTGIVERFYDLMESDASFASLRALHADDLTPMRGSLAGYLAAWLGGPADWFVEHPKSCIISAHGQLPITAAIATQWIDAMDKALRDADIEPAIAGSMMMRLRPMAMAMINIREMDGD